MKFLNNQQIVALVNQDTTRKIMFRHGDDLRFTNRDGMVERGSKRNREYSLFDLFKVISKGNYIVELEEGETDEKQIVFTVIPATICGNLVCMYMIGSTILAIANKISK